MNEILNDIRAEALEVLLPVIKIGGKSSFIGRNWCKSGNLFMFYRDNTSWYQRYLKKSCPRLCGECGLDSSEDLDAPPSPHFCADEIPLQYKCTQPV